MVIKLSGVWRVLAAAGSACVLTLVVTPFVRRFALRWGYVDRPSGDRWAQRVVARLGGIALFIGIIGSTLVWVHHMDRLLVGLLCSAVLVFGLGVVDDVHRLRPYTKLLWQLAVGSFLVMWGVRIELIQWLWVSLPLSIFWVVLVMNAFNLLDNMDGLAAGIGAVASAFCACHAVSGGQWMVATMAAIVSGACVGFLRYNVPPAKIYMGDSGSHLLGLSLSALALLGTWRHSTQLISILAVPALVLAVPIFDTCFVTIQRLMHRTHPFQGGKDHVSHRLAILGLSQRQTVLVLWIVSAAFGVLSLVAIQAKPLSTLVMWLLMLAVVLLAGVYLAKVRVYEVRREDSTEPVARAPYPTTLMTTMLMHKRRVFEVIVDFSLIVSSYVVAHLLRFEATVTPEFQQRIIQSLPIILMIRLACFAGCGLYRGVWRYLGISDIISLFKAVTSGSVLSAVAVLYIWRFEGYSRAVFIIDWMLLLLAVGGSRVIERLLDEWIGAMAKQGTSTLIIGAGDTGARVLRYLKDEMHGTKRVVGFLDDDVRKSGNRIHQCRVLGTRERLAELLTEYAVQEVLVAINDPPGELLQYIQQCCHPLGVTWKVVTAGVTDAL